MKNIKFINLLFLVFILIGCANSDLTGVADKVLVPPIAIAGEDIHIRTDENVTLSAKDSYDSDGSLIAYSWEENGIVLSTGIELKNYHSKIVGTHVITLKVLDNDELNASDTVNIFVTLENQPPVANAGVDKQIHVSDKITLDGSASSDSDGNIVSYEWKEKGSSEVLSTGVKLKDYTSEIEAIHILQLKVTDNEGLSDIDYVYVSVLNKKTPIANAGNDQTVVLGHSITLDGKGTDVDGNIVSYEWKEGSTVLGTAEDLVNYTFSSVGKHTLVYTVTDNDGNTNSDTVVVTVVASNVAPIANAGDNKNIRVGESVLLEGNASIDSDGNITFYLWKEGETTLGTGSALNYSSTVVGAHIVELTVTDNGGLTNTDTTTVTVVANNSPIANAGNDQTIVIGQSITLDGSKSNDDVSISTYSWEEGGVVLGTGENLIAYTPTTLGEHHITLRVKDNEGITNSDTVVVTVVAANVAPIANAGDNKNIREGESVLLDGSASTDSDGSIASYLWKEGMTILGTGSALNYSSTVVGAHIVELTVTDNGGLTNTDTTTVTVVANNSPIANAGNDQTIRIGQSITLDGRATDNDGNIVKYEWKEGATVLGTSEDLINYTFSSIGIHTLVYTVTDNDGLSNSDTVVVTVRAANVAPVANAGDNKNIRVNEYVILNGSASYDSDGSIAAYLWKEGVNTLGTGSSLNYSTNLIGAHIVELTVTDNEGLTHTDTTTVTVVGNSSPLANAGADRSVRVGESVTLHGVGNDGDGSIVGYEWREGSTILGISEDLVDYTFTDIGTHTIVYTVTDNDGLTNSDTVIVTVRAANVAPVADAGEDKSVKVLENVTLDGSGSSDSDGTIIAYEWKEGSEVLGTAESLVYSSSDLGGHTIDLKVTDNEGLDSSDSVYVTVTN